MEKDPVRKFLDGIEESESDFVQRPSFKEEIVPVEDEVIEEPIVEEKPLPFNKDPKVQRFIEKEISKRMEQFTVQSPQEERKPLVDEDYYIRLIGNDTPEKVAMIKESMARDERLLEIAEERAFSRLSQSEQEALMADREAEEELANAFDNIEDTFGVDITSNNPIARKTRSDFISYVEKIAPKDRNGDIVDYPDMVSAWETYQELRQRQPSRAKELASRSMGRSTETQAPAPQKMGWDKVDEYIDSLS